MSERDSRGVTTDYGDGEGDGPGGGNRTVLIVLIVVILIVGLPAIIIGGLLLGRSTDSSDIEASPGQSIESSSTTSEPTTTSSAPSTTESSTTTEGGSDDEGPGDLSGADNSLKETPFPAQDTSHLKEIRVASHPGFDRVVFEFTGEVPGYRIEYVDQLTEDGSGKHVKIQGAPMQVILSPASGVDIGVDGVDQIYTGPDRIGGTGRAVKEVVESGDFEGQMSWGIGVAGRRPFTVKTMEKPSRVVIDIKAN